MQRCPTLSPFATCGDRTFKCGDRKFLQKLLCSKVVYEIAVLLLNSLNCGDSKDFVATKVVNVATRIILVGQRWSNVMTILSKSDPYSWVPFIIIFQLNINLSRSNIHKRRREREDTDRRKAKVFVIFPYSLSFLLKLKVQNIGTGQLFRPLGKYKNIMTVLVIVNWSKQI